MLLIPAVGICQQPETEGMFDLKMDAVMAFFSKDSIKQADVLEDFNALNAILRKDIGEAALMKELGALDRIKDSIAFYNLVTTKPAALYKRSY